MLDTLTIRAAAATAARVGFAWRATDALGAFTDADGYRTLLAMWARCERSGAPLPVFAGGSARTVYGAPAVNHAARFWHDAVHVRTGADFTADGERRTARAQLAEAARLGWGRDALRVLRADVLGQAERFAETGAFVDNQADFVRCYLATRG